MTELKILDIRDGGFTGSDQVHVDYYWHTAIRTQDETQIQFGSSKRYEPGAVIQVLLVRKESAKDGKVRWVEQTTNK